MVKIKTVYLVYVGVILGCILWGLPYPPSWERDFILGAALISAGFSLLVAGLDFLLWLYLGSWADWRE